MNHPLRLLLCAGLCALPLVSSAKVDSISIPNQGWKIVVDAPPLTPVSENSLSDSYSYAANSGNFNLSLFVEPPQVPHAGNKECYEFYWGKGRRNPMINQDSVMVSHTPAFYRVEYTIEAGKNFSQRNVNYFFVYQERWVDVHISLVESAQSSDALFEAFDRGLKVEQEQVAAPAPPATGVQILQLSQTDALRVTIPPRWQMGPIVKPTKTFPFKTFTFKPADGRNASCWVTLYAKFKPGAPTTTPPQLREMITQETAPEIAMTAEKKMPAIHDFTFPHSRGVSASFIDANLVGKSPVPDDFKFMTCYVICIQGANCEYLGKITASCDDPSSSEAREQVTLIQSLVEAK